MNSKQFLQNELGGLDIEQLLEQYMGRSGNVGRGGGGGMSRDSSLDPALVQKAASFDAKYDQQVADAIAIAKDDTATAEIVEQYLGYENDPEYQALDKQASEARASMNSGGGAGWNWATKGRYFDSLQQRLMANTAGQREIKQRYLDKMNLKLAQQEQFDPKQTKNEYNWDTKDYERVAYGTKGTRRIYGKGEMPQETVETQYGDMVTVPKRPGTQVMIQDPTIDPAYLSGESKDINEPTAEFFHSGDAEVYPPMQKLGKPKSKTLAETTAESAIAENKAQEAQALAAAERNLHVNIPANSLYGRIDPKTGQLGPTKQAPANPNWAPPGGGASATSREDALVESTFGRLLANVSAYREIDANERAELHAEAERLVRGKSGNSNGMGQGGFLAYQYDPSQTDPSDTRPLTKLGPGMGRNAAPPMASGSSGPAEGDVGIDSKGTWKIVNGKRFYGR